MAAMPKRRWRAYSGSQFPPAAVFPDTLRSIRKRTQTIHQIQRTRITALHLLVIAMLHPVPSAVHLCVDG